MHLVNRHAALFLEVSLRLLSLICGLKRQRNLQICVLVDVRYYIISSEPRSASMDLYVKSK